MYIEVIKVFSFTDTVNQGNPAGVVFNADNLTDNQMMFISEKLKVSETAFLYLDDEADFFVRFFSPSCEIDLCGHATIAAFSVVGKQNENKKENIITLRQKTNVGILTVKCLYDNFYLKSVMMQQNKPVIKSVRYSNRKIANALSIQENNIQTDLPKKRVSTGLFTLPILVDSYDTLKKMKPDFKLVKKFCQMLDVGSIHVFTFDTIEESSLYHARNFAPLYGINEDPVTGTANGAVCAYLDYYKKLDDREVVCEQGDIIGKSGRIHVDVSKDSVWVGGKAVIYKSEVISI